MKLNHFGAVIRDAEATLDFYLNKLGAKMLWDTTEPQEGRQTDIIFGFPNTKVRVVGIQLHGTMIEFFQFISPKVKEQHPDSTGYATVGWKHIAIQVEDIHAEVDKLKNKGVEFLFPVQQLPQGAKMVYFLDNEGLMLELIEVATTD